jgi:copper chaperone CopZ
MVFPTTFPYEKNKVREKMSQKFQEEMLEIKGMHCKSCAEAIELKLKAIKGIQKAKVSYIDEKAFVVFDSSQISSSAIRGEIENMGYNAGVGDSAKAHDGIVSVKKNKGIMQGIKYGLVPHVGCIAFILASVFGVTAATQLFEPLMLNPYFFYMLIGLSFAFSTISAIIYLKNQGFIEFKRNGSELGFSVAPGTLRRKWKYLTTMYGTSIGVNLLLFLVIFPLLANVTIASPLIANSGSLSELKLQVDIPCSGHATLISGDIKQIAGIASIQFSLPNIFDVKYDPTVTSKQQILALDVFNTYKATVLSESTGVNVQTNQVNVPATGNVIATQTGSGSLAPIVNGVQTVRLSVQGTTYYPSPIRVKVGIPVQLVADIANMSGCSKSIVIPEFGISKTVSASDNIIQFTPTKSGTFKFSCAMNMYQGQIIVVNADGSVATYTGSTVAPSGSTCGGSGGGCGCGGA